jgi:hypothetical protein
MVQYEQSTLEYIVSLKQHNNHQEILGFYNKNCVTRRLRRHLVTQFSVANGKKQISQACKIFYGSFIKLRSIIKKLYKF